MMKRIEAYLNVILGTATVTFIIGLIAEAYTEYGILRHETTPDGIVILSIVKWVVLYIICLGANVTRLEGKISKGTWTIHWGLIIIIYAIVTHMIIECVTTDVQSRGTIIWGICGILIGGITWCQAQQIMDKA